MHDLRYPLFTLLIGCLPAQDLPNRPDHTPAPRPLEAAAAALQGLTSPVTLQERIGATPQSRVLFDRPRDGALWALGTAWKAGFDGTGVTVVPFFGSHAPRNFPLRIELGSASVGGQALPLTEGKPQVVGTAVHTDRGALTEVVATGLEQLEQSFVFEQLPNRGEIAVELRFATELSVEPIDGGLRFANEHGHVDYTKAVAVDARGARLPLTIERTDRGARIEIPAEFVADAVLPIVLDPVLNYWFSIASGQTQPQKNSDVAAIQATSIGGRTLLVYQRQWSTTDQDVFGVLFDGNLGLVATDFSIDFTDQDHLAVAVAGHNQSQTFLVTSEVRIGLTWFIAGRIAQANGTLGTWFDIERDGVVGAPGQNFAPDVGSDPYFGSGRYCVVFAKSPNVLAGRTSIYCKLVNPNGTLANPTPTLIDTNAAGVDRPSISKSCGQSNGLPANWLVTWERKYPSGPFDRDVHGRFVVWNGALAGSSFQISGSVFEETAPTASSPIDANGIRYWPVAFETAPALGQTRDLTGRLLRSDGVSIGSFAVSNGVPGADDHSPEIDSDGTRFVTTFTTAIAGYPSGVEAVTMAWLWETSTFRVEERTGLLTSSASPYAETNIVADFSGGGAMSPRYFVSFTEQGSNTFRLENFGGWTGGADFFFYQGVSCGSLGITASGNPAIGQTVTVTAGDGSASVLIVGTPGYEWLGNLGCNCSLAVETLGYVSNPMVLTIPNNPSIVGFTVAVQAATPLGTQCLGYVDVSDAIHFSVR